MYFFQYKLFKTKFNVKLHMLYQMNFRKLGNKLQFIRTYQKHNYIDKSQKLFLGLIHSVNFKEDG